LNVDEEGKPLVDGGGMGFEGFFQIIQNPDFRVRKFRAEGSAPFGERFQEEFLLLLHSGAALRA
jgi:hypothetical protein